MTARSLAARLVAAIGIAAALALTGCTFMAPTATLIHYDPVDGVGANLGDVKLRNVIAVTNEDGSIANISFTAINTGDGAELNYSIPTEDGKQESFARVPAGSTNFGEPGPHRIIVEGPDARVGGLLPITFQVGDSDSTTVLAPVLDAQGREYLEPLVP